MSSNVFSAVLLSLCLLSTTASVAAETCIAIKIVRTEDPVGYSKAIQATSIAFENPQIVDQSFDSEHGAVSATEKACRQEKWVEVTKAGRGDVGESDFRFVATAEDVGGGQFKIDVKIDQALPSGNVTITSAGRAPSTINFPASRFNTFSGYTEQHVPIVSASRDPGLAIYVTAWSE